MVGFITTYQFKPTTYELAVFLADFGCNFTSTFFIIGFV